MRALPPVRLRQHRQPRSHEIILLPYLRQKLLLELPPATEPMHLLFESAEALQQRRPRLQALATTATIKRIGRFIRLGLKHAIKLIRLHPKL